MALVPVKDRTVGRPSNSTVALILAPVPTVAQEVRPNRVPLTLVQVRTAASREVHHLASVARLSKHKVRPTLVKAPAAPRALKAHHPVRLVASIQATHNSTSRQVHNHSSEAI